MVLPGAAWCMVASLLEAAFYKLGDGAIKP